MRTLCWAALATLVLAQLALPAADAGIFSRKEKPAPEVQVMEHLKNLKNNPRAGERADAADDLGAFDSLAFPEIVPALINALQNDSSSSVRKQAAESLGKLRPTSVEAEQALEQAEKQDSSLLVRWRARTSLLGYRVPPVAKPPVVSVPPPSRAPIVVKEQPKPAPAQPAQPTRPLPTPDTSLTEHARPTPPPAETGPILTPPRTVQPASLARPVPKSPAPPPVEDGPILLPPMR